MPLVVLLVTSATFSRALQNDFVNWDDDRNLLQNERFRGLGGPQLRWMLSTYWGGHYHPLTWLSFAIDYSIWGLDERGALGFHLSNVLLHAGNAVLFYWLARRLLRYARAGHVPRRAAPGNDTAFLLAAGLAALLFALHPLRVESVAWVTERRDVLSTFFLLPCLLAYMRYAEGQPGRWRWYLGALALLWLSLLSKAWGLTLPAILLILDAYPLRRFQRGRWPGLLLEKVPFAALAAWAAFHAFQAQAAGPDTMKTLAEYGWLPRIAQACYGVAFYLWKTVWPAGLVPIHEIPLKPEPLAAPFILSAVAVVAVTVALVVQRRRWPAGLASWAGYVIVLAPVLGLTQAGPQLVADRYSYVACLPWALLAAAGLLRLVERLSTPRARVACGAAAAGVLAVLAGLTWRQTGIWHDSATLWAYTLKRAPGSYSANNNMGAVLQTRGDYDAAAGYYQAALGIKPNGWDALAGYGGLLSNLGRPAEALPYLQRGLELNPDDGRVLANLAITLQRLGRDAEAAAYYRRRLALDTPRVERAKLTASLAATLMNLGQKAEALDLLHRAVALAPAEDLPVYNLGVGLRMTGDLEGAWLAFEEAARLAHDRVQADPRALPATQYVEALLAAGDIRAQRGDFVGARERFKRAAELAPRDPRVAERLARLGPP